MSSQWFSSHLMDQGGGAGQYGEDNVLNKSLSIRIQVIVCKIFSNIIEMHLWSPYLYCLLQILSFLQVLFFVMFNINFEKQGSESTLESGDIIKSTVFNEILGYLPIFPQILSSKNQEAFVAAQISLLGLDLGLFLFLAWYVFKQYQQEDIHAHNGEKSKGGIQSGVSGSAPVITALSLMQLKEESNAQEDDPEEANGQKVHGILKIVLRLSSLYLVVQNEFLAIPGLIFSLVPLVCEKATYQNKDGVYYSVEEDYYTGMQCWAGLHSFMFICGILHLTLIIVNKLLFLYFMNDDFLGQQAPPWTQYNQRPSVLLHMSFIIYSLWFVFDTDKNYGVVVNCICLVLFSLALSIRLFSPIFPNTQGSIIKNSTVILDTCRFWITFLAVLHQLSGRSIDALDLTVSVLLAIFLCWLALAYIEHKTYHNLLKGQQNLLKDDDFELFISTINEMTRCDATVSRHNLRLQGLLQVHQQTCKDLKCPCELHMGTHPHKLSTTLAIVMGNQKDRYEDKGSLAIENAGAFDEVGNSTMKGGDDGNNGIDEEDNPFKKRRTLQVKGFKVGIGGLSALSKTERLRLIADSLIVKFEVIKSQKGIGHAQNVRNSQAPPPSRYQAINSKDEIDSKVDVTWHWDQIIKYWIKLRLLQTDKPISFKLRYLVAQFFFQRIQNEFQALFEVMLAENSMNLDVHSRFKLHCLRKRIEHSIVARYELLNLSSANSVQEDKRVNILQVFEFETGFSRLQSSIFANTQNSISFWQQLLEKTLDVTKLHETGIAISERHQEISRIANRLLVLQPSNVPLLLMYSRYLNDIINNEYYAYDIFYLAFNQRLSFKMASQVKNESIQEKESMMFGENGFCTIFILRTDFKNLGVIEFTNHEVYPMFGFRPDWLVGKDISVIMPELIGSVHRQLMVKFFDKGESPIINKFRDLFVKDADGYLVPVIIYPKVLPNLSGGLKFIGAIKRIIHLDYPPEVTGDLAKLGQEYMICDKDNYVQHFTSGLSVDLGLFPKMFMHPGGGLGDQGRQIREIKIDDLSLDFVNKEQELLQDGCYINLNTNKLVEKIEQENLSNEEYTYFLSKRFDFKIFSQLIHLNFGHLSEVKMYRIILVQNMAAGPRGSGNNMDLRGLENSRAALMNEANKVPGSGAQVSGDDKFNQDSGGFNLNIASQSASSQGSASSVFSMDRQLRDLKLHITDNMEPKQIAILRRIVWLLVTFLLISSSLVYQFHSSESSSHSSQMTGALRALEMDSKFIQLQMNLRTMIDIANGIESARQGTEMPYIKGVDRMIYLRNLSSVLVEDVRTLNNFLASSNQGQKPILIREIDRNGFPYEYQVETKLALDQYVTKVLEMLYESQLNLSSLISQASFVNPTYDRTVPNMTSPGAIDYSLAKSIFYVMSTGYRSLLPIIESRVTLLLFRLSNFSMFTLQAIKWLDIVSAIFILLVHMMLAVVVQMIQENKVRVLSLYSEVRVSLVRESLLKCQKYNNFIAVRTHGRVHKKNNGRQTARSANGLDKASSLMLMRSVEYIEDNDDEDDEKNHFRNQWEAFNSRLTYYKMDESQRMLNALKESIVQQMINLEQDEGAGATQRQFSLKQAAERMRSINKHDLKANDMQIHAIFAEEDESEEAFKESLSKQNDSSDHQFLNVRNGKRNMQPQQRRGIMKKTSLAQRVGQTAIHQAMRTNKHPFPFNRSQMQNEEKAEEIKEHHHNHHHHHVQHLHQVGSITTQANSKHQTIKKAGLTAPLGGYRSQLGHQAAEEDDEDEDGNDDDSNEQDESESQQRSEDQSTKLGSNKELYLGGVSPRGATGLALDLGGQLEMKDYKVGKEDQFKQIQKRNWRQIGVIITISLLLITYYGFSYFFHESVNKEVRSSSNDLKVGMSRQRSVNMLFASMRERVILQDANSTEFFSEKETQSLALFYANEDQIQQQMIKHENFEDFLYSHINTLDSKDFCNSLQPAPLFENCLSFHKGVLEQGYKQSLFSFIKYYTQLNFTSQTSINATSRRIAILNNSDINAFFLSQESFYQRVTEVLVQKWDEKITEHDQWEQSVYKAAFALFLIIFFFVEFIVIPRLIKQLNETTWRSRGILNLVPNEAFKELKGNPKIMMLFNANNN